MKPINGSDSIVLRTVLGGLVGLGLLGLMMTSLIGYELLTGWASFVRRVFPKVRLRPDGIALFCFGTFAVVVLTHFFLHWLVRESQRKRNAKQVPWPLASSFSLVSIVLLIFGIGIAMAGIVHQVGWIINSPVGSLVNEVQSESDARRSPYQPEVLAKGNQASWIFESLIFTHVQPTINRNEPWNSPSNAEKIKCLVVEALCPSQGYPHKTQDGLGLTHVVGNREVTESEKKLRLQDLDGIGQTVLGGEIQIGFSPWAMPNNGRSMNHGIRSDWNNTPNAQLGFGSTHGGGANLMVLDGSVSFMSDKTDAKVLEQLGRLKLVPDGAK